MLQILLSIQEDRAYNCDDGYFFQIYILEDVENGPCVIFLGDVDDTSISWKYDDVIDTISSIESGPKYCRF